MSKLSVLIHSITLKDAATYGGVTLNLVWNAWNWYQTRELRRDAIRVEELKRIRAPVDAALIKLKQSRMTLRSLDASANFAKLKEGVNGCNEAMAAAFAELTDALRDLDHSQYISGEDWTGKAEALWDDFLRQLDVVHASGDLDGAKNAIRQSFTSFDSLVSEINRKLTAEIAPPTLLDRVLSTLDRVLSTLTKRRAS